MRRLIKFLAFIFIINSSLYGQVNQITGVVLDSFSQEPIPYANVFIKNENDSLINGIITNEKGKFNISTEIQNIKITISCLGYSDSIIPLQLKDKKTSIGNVLLLPLSTILNEVSVEDIQSNVIVKFDRKIYPVTPENATSASTILELLRTLPGVVIDNEGNVRYKGAEASIYIDDKPYWFLYPNIEMIPTVNIVNIELVDVAMQTGGTGLGGIINIRMKYPSDDGFSGLISSNAKTNINALNNTSSLININYKYKKLTFLNNFSYRSTNEVSHYNTTKYINTFLTPFRQLSIINSNLTSENIYDYLGCLYNPTNATEIYFGLGYFNFNYYNESKSTFLEKELITNNETTRYSTISKGNSEQIYSGLNFSLTHKFDTNDTYLNMYGGLQNNTNNFIFNDIEEFYIFNSIFSDSILNKETNSNSGFNKISFNSTYNHTITDKTRLTATYNCYFEINDTNKDNQFINDNLNILYSKISTKSSLDQNLALRFGSIVNKWQLDGGLTISNNIIDGQFLRYLSINNDTTLLVKKNNLALNPSINIYYNINSESALKLTIAKTTRFPFFFQLSDFIDKNSIFYWSSGNSSLKPVDYYSLFFGYNINKSKYNFSTDFFISHTNNEVANISYPITSLLTLSKYDNVANKNTYGFDIASWFIITKKLNASLSSSIYAVNYSIIGNDTMLTQFSNSLQYGGNIKTNISYRLNKYRISMFFAYNSKAVFYNGYNFNWINSTININRNFLNNNLIVSIGLHNIFDNFITQGNYSESYNVISNSVTKSSKHDCMIFLSLRYSIRKGDRNTQHLQL